MLNILTFCVILILEKWRTRPIVSVNRIGLTDGGHGLQCHKIGQAKKCYMRAFFKGSSLFYI